MPKKKHDRSHYSHLDSIDDETLDRIAALVAEKMKPHFLVEPVLVEADDSGLPTYVVDGPSIDAFGRLRVSSPAGIFDSQNQYDLSPILWESAITNNSGSATVTHLPNESSVRLIVGANDTIVRQTRQYHHYQPGKSQQILLTFVPASPYTNVTQRVGYFDAQNGIFLEISSAGVINIVKRSFVTGVVVETRIARDDWNIDSLDGTGVSGHNLDFTKAQILAIDLEWLGVGRVRVGFAFDGLIHTAHAFEHTNELSTVYMTTANLPLRYEVVGAAGLAGTATFRQICSQVSSEGGIELERGYLLSVGNGASTISVGTRAPLLSIRPRATFNSIVNRAFTIIEDVVLANGGNNGAYYEVVYGGTLTGASFNNVNTSYSGMEFDVAATAITGGISIAADYALATATGKGKSLKDFATRYPIALNIAGNHPTTPLTDSITVVAVALTGTTTLGASLTWREVR